MLVELNCIVIRVTVFAWEAYEKGADIHLQADPTKLEMLASEFKQRKKEFKTATKESIVEKYGGEEHLEAPPKQLLLAQTVRFVVMFNFSTFYNGWCIIYIETHNYTSLYIIQNILYLLYRKITSNIRDMAQLSKAKRKPWSSHATKRTCISITTQYVQVSE